MNIIHIIGTFHQQMSFMYALYKRFKCSCLNDILVTAGIVLQGSVEQVLRDRHYWCGEILIQKHFNQILQYEDLPAAAQHSLDTVHNALTATQVTLPEANSCLVYDVFMRHLITKVYEKSDTDMGDFWISFVEMPEPLMRFLDACHARNSNEYMSLTYSLLLD